MITTPIKLLAEMCSFNPNCAVVCVRKPDVWTVFCRTGPDYHHQLLLSGKSSKSAKIWTESQQTKVCTVDILWLRRHGVCAVDLYTVVGGNTVCTVWLDLSSLFFQFYISSDLEHWLCYNWYYLFILASRNQFWHLVSLIHTCIMDQWCQYCSWLAAWSLCISPPTDSVSLSAVEGQTWTKSRGGIHCRSSQIYAFVRLLITALLIRPAYGHKFNERNFHK